MTRHATLQMKKMVGVVLEALGKMKFFGLGNVLGFTQIDVSHPSYEKNLRNTAPAQKDIDPPKKSISVLLVPWMSRGAVENRFMNPLVVQPEPLGCSLNSPPWKSRKRLSKIIAFPQFWDDSNSRT